MGVQYGAVIAVQRIKSIFISPNHEPTLAQLEERETVMDTIILRSPVRARQVGFFGSRLYFYRNNLSLNFW